MAIRIYVNEKPFIITEQESAINEMSRVYKQAEIIKKPLQKNIPEYIRSLHQDESQGMILQVKSKEKFFKAFEKNFRIVTAAGGVVQNENKDVLFIFRHNKWDLPKGKCEKSEKLEECAEREISEETGITNLKYRKKICVTYHVYEEKGALILKPTHWFYFLSSGNDKLTPQETESISEVRWFSTEKISEPMKNTYANIRNVITEFFDTP